MNNIDNLNNITNELILNYDEKFNELYNEKNIIDKGIMNKEELIKRYDEEILIKNQNITYLNYILLLFFLVSLLVTLNVLNIIDTNILLYGSLGLIVIFILIILYYRYFMFNNININNGANLIGINMKAYAESLFGIDTMPYKCPVKCDKNKDKKNDNYSNSSDILKNINDINNKLGGYMSGDDGPTLKTDSQRNVWKYGEQNNKITNLDNNSKDDLNNVNSTYPYSVYYKCESLNGNNSGLPTKELNKYSTIPCDYRENFNEVGKYICNTDPNKINGDISAYCTNITSS
jgi:hypothetical protein